MKGVGYMSIVYLDAKGGVSKWHASHWATCAQMGQLTMSDSLA